jgi:tetrahydromethanopterin S-methyltransferase subunit D
MSGSHQEALIVCALLTAAFSSGITGVTAGTIGGSFTLERPFPDGQPDSLAVSSFWSMEFLLIDASFAALDKNDFR